MAVTPEILAQIEWIVEDFNQDPALYSISKVIVPNGIVMDVFYEEEITNKIIKLLSSECYFLDSNGYYRRLVLKNLYNENEEKEKIKKLLYTTADREEIRKEFFNKKTIAL